LVIEHQLTYWARNHFVELVPPVRFPTTHSERDICRIMLRVPDKAVIAAVQIPATTHYTVRFPPGTRLDRIESMRYGDDRAEETITDVRGSVVEPNQRMRFHLYRPIGAQSHALLEGRTWIADDVEAQSLADRWLTSFLRNHEVPYRSRQLAEPDIVELVQFNHCSLCHIPNRWRQSVSVEDGLPQRSTDANGFYTPLAVLSDSVPLSSNRVWDLNADDPYVRVTCSGAPAGLIETPDSRQFKCPKGRLAVGSRDIQRGLANRDSYTIQVCKARQYLFEHMTEQARHAFAAAFAVC
jgi:hypothetical protein